ncbi:lipopolysaccharide assembly protein LapA domain-containing protein [Limnohabitans sp.]|uniref:lipopolysaccharide assembly protein LapA domain-containing protein n=1 Tax=Limnohabitans sp. TaxID=1907725 RepID=UPI003340D35A
MKNLMWLLQFILKAAIFFTLFAFALNNQHDAVVHFFFGTTWRAPLVLVLLAVFVMGVAIGVIGMVPRWLKHRRLVQLADTSAPEIKASASSSADPTHGT